MSDNLDSTPVVVDPQGISDPDSSQLPGGQPNSSGQVDAIVSAVLERIDGEIEKRVQSVKDKRFDTLEKTQKAEKDRLDRFAELIGEGKSPAQAKELLETEEDLAYIRQMRSSRPPVVDKQVDVSGAVEAIAYALDVDLNDPDVKQWLASTPAVDPKAFVDFTKNRKKPPPSLGGVISPSGSSPKGEFDGISSDELGLRLEQMSLGNPINTKIERQKIVAELERRDKIK